MTSHDYIFGDNRNIHCLSSTLSLMLVVPSLIPRGQKISKSIVWNAV